MGNGDSVEIARLEAGFSEIVRRMDQARADSQVRHSENVVRLERIETECRRTNGRVTALELTQVKDAVTMPRLHSLVAIVLGSLGALWFVLTQVLGFHR